MADPIVHLVLAVDRRVVSVYAAGSALVRAACPTAASAGPHGAMAEFSPEAVRALIDSLAAAADYYPERPGIVEQREALRAGADELRQLRRDADQDANAPGNAVLQRHVGHFLADSAYLIFRCRDHMGDRTVAEMAAEVVGLIDAIGPIQITNREERQQAHLRRIQELREQLPQPERTS